jgi:hypothetical protein
MKTIHILRLSALAAGLLAPATAFAGLIVSAPIDVVGNLPLAQFVGDNFATQAYKDWGNEPYVTVNPTNTNQIVVSSFAFGAPPNADASFFYSTNGGTSWTAQFSVPQPSAAVTIPTDWNFDYDSAGTLHAAVLGCSGAKCANNNVYFGTTTNPTTPAAWTWTNAGAQINTAPSSGNADQPWLKLSGNNVLVAYDDFHASVVERVVASSNLGTSFPTDNPVSNIAGNPQNASSVNPGTRIAVDGKGAIYSIFGYATAINNPSNGVNNNVAYFINRSTNNGASWDFLGNSTIGGIQLPTTASAKTISTQLCNGPPFGTCTQASNTWFAGVNDLRGNTTAIAADKTGAHIYAVYGMQDKISGVDRLYLDELHPGPGNTLAPSTPISLGDSVPGQRAALPGVTVKDDGTVVIMYDTYDARNNLVNVHVASSTDFGASIASDIVEYSFEPLSLTAATGSAAANREFGDYDFLTSIDNTVYGTFAGLGDVNIGGIDTTGLIDPFFFTATDVPEPASWALVLTGLAGAGWLRRRKNRG